MLISNFLTFRMNFLQLSILAISIFSISLNLVNSASLAPMGDWVFGSPQMPTGDLSGNYKDALITGFMSSSYEVA